MRTRDYRLPGKVSALSALSATTRRPRFWGWLRLQLDRDDPVGDLARDATRDPEAPRSATTLIRYLDEISDLAADAAREAYREYLERWPAPEGLSTRVGVSARLRAMVLERDQFTCRRCGARASEVRLHVDHIVPVAQGGETEFENLQTLCQLCNLGKGDRAPTAHDRAATQ